MMEATFTCSLCGAAFNDAVSERDDRIDCQDSDFRVHANGIQLAYLIHTCPECGYTDHRHDGDLSDDCKEDIRTYLQQKRQTSEGGFLYTKKYVVYANLLLLRDMPSVEVADAYLKAAWIADDAGDTARSRTMRDKALAFYVKALAQDEVPPVELPVVQYMAGELNRRLGRFRESRYWFEKVETRDRHLETLCRQQAELARQENAAGSRIPSPL